MLRIRSPIVILSNCGLSATGNKLFYPFMDVHVGVIAPPNLDAAYEATRRLHLKTGHCAATAEKVNKTKLLCHSITNNYYITFC